MRLWIHFWNLRESARALFERRDATPAQARPILDELRDFCRADVSCVVVAKDGRIDTHATAVAEGRREARAFRFNFPSAHPRSTRHPPTAP